VVKSLPSSAAAYHLSWLAGQMKTRADMFRVIQDAGVVAPALPIR
jgi:hypothetical protein